MSPPAIDYDALASQHGGSAAVDYDALAAQSGGQVVQAAPGQFRNDVGNTVIVPKLAQTQGLLSSLLRNPQDESFADTMKRAAAYGRTVTPGQLNAEEATIPGKAATVLAAAPVIGFGGTAALAGPGELPGLGSRAIQGAKAIESWVKANPAKAASLEFIARELGVDPFQLVHKVVKYGKNLFGGELGAQGGQ